MEKLTPRSYVTGGFDIIKPSLIDFIGKTLRKTGKTWWHDYIYTFEDIRNEFNQLCYGE